MRRICADLGDGKALRYHRAQMTGGNNEFRFFDVVQGYMEEAAELVALPTHVRRILAEPKNELIVHFPVRMDKNSRVCWKPPIPAPRVSRYSRIVLHVVKMSFRRLE